MTAVQFRAMCQDMCLVTVAQYQKDWTGQDLLGCRVHSPAVSGNHIL